MGLVKSLYNFGCGLPWLNLQLSKAARQKSIAKTVKMMDATLRGFTWITKASSRFTSW